MKHEEFLELLNLYLDHEISAADASRLEAEVQSDAARRAIYHEYCRMQKACMILASDFRETEVATAESGAGGKVVAFGTAAARRRSRVQLVAAASATLVAACVTLVFVWPDGVALPAKSAGGVAASAPGNAQPVGLVPNPGLKSLARGLVSVANRQDSGEASKVTLVTESLVLSGIRPSPSVITVGLSPDDQLAWMRNFQLVSIQERNQLDQLRFDAPPPTLRPDRRQLGTRAPAEAAVEMTAFRFVK